MYLSLKSICIKTLPVVLVVSTLSIASAELSARTSAATLFNGRARKINVSRTGKSETQTVRYYWRDTNTLTVLHLNKNVEEGSLTQYNVSQRAGKNMDMARVKGDQAVALVKSLDQIDYRPAEEYIALNNHDRKPGVVYKGMSLPSLALDADTKLVAFALSSTKDSAVWLIKRPLQSRSSSSQAQFTLLLQIGKKGLMQQVGSITDWPEADSIPDIALQWSPDGKNISFVRRHAVYILPVE